MNAKKKKKTRKKRKQLQGVEDQQKASRLLPEFSSFAGEEFAEDIVWLLRSSPDNLRGSEAAADFVVKSVLPTSEMAAEPEFENIVHEPTLCAKTIYDVTKETGVNTETFGSLPRPIAESIRMQINEETIKKVLDDKFREKVLEGLNAYRLRKRRGGDKMEAGKAAAIMLILKEKKNETVWPRIGLLHGILHNCVEVGQEIMDSLRDIKEGKVTGLNEKIVSRVKDDARLREFLINEVNRVIVEGNNALLDGRLKLDLFTREEIDRASEVLVEAFKTGVEPESREENSVVPKFTEEGQKIVTSGLGAIVDEVITPERMENAREKIEDKLKGKDDAGKWAMFLISVRSKLEKESTPEKLKSFFIRALFGEAATAENGDS